MERSKILRCMAYKKGELYIAECLDLSLATQGNSFDEVEKKLDDQLEDYLNEAFSDKRYTRQLLNRPSPFSSWVRYYWFRFLLIAKNGKGKDVSFFEERCTA